MDNLCENAFTEMLAMGDFQPRDEVLAFADEKTTDPSRVVGILSRLEPGTTVPIEIVRDWQGPDAASHRHPTSCYSDVPGR